MMEKAKAWLAKYWSVPLVIVVLIIGAFVYRKKAKRSMSIRRKMARVRRAKKNKRKK